MDWKKIAPWNWFKEEESAGPGSPSPLPFDTSNPFDSLRFEMGRYFEDRFRSGAAMANRPALPLRPSVDISEGKKAYTVFAELPGVDVEEVTIEVVDRTLAIRAEKRQETEEDDEGYHWIERSYGLAQRVLSLPEDADAESIEAQFEAGVLKLRIPKCPPTTSKSRSIEIQRG